MFATTTLADAAKVRWDVVIAGSSFSAMFFLRGLPPDSRVLIVEKGELVDHATQIEQRDDRAKDDYAMTNTSGHRKDWFAHRLFGGNSNCWWGQTPRFHPNDFRLAELYGVGAPWPLDYDTLEPFYTEVEELMEIAGGGTEAIFPRSAPYPYPPHIPARTDIACMKAMPQSWFHAPSARSNGGSRPTCCANGVCDLCPIESKFTILNSVDSFSRDGVSLLLQAEARHVGIAAGAADGLVVRGVDGTEVTLHADLVALGANAINNATILLRSGLTSPALGRYLHEQASYEIEADIGAPNYYGGTSITGHCYALYDGPHRRDRAAVLVENYNSPYSLRTEPGRWTDRISIKLIAEDIPQAENRVELDADGEPHIHWQGHSDYAMRGLDHAIESLPDILPFPVERIVRQVLSITEAHIQGTHRMGDDPAASVTDGYMRTHEVSGLYALGAGGYPTSSPVNPTLTLSALALRAGRSA
ncbi:GMC oxidoreductase [Pseudoruegeria sp. HB172150]|uniref:GMC oxidoreductase n=1 Tax=Pseudoruegeria sp. HB172150 TaxID=2721164 RepID=UPI0015571C47|nr:GMC family oxidoreductase [Pseudoruegeria sp. HB172150]